MGISRPISMRATRRWIACAMFLSLAGPVIFLGEGYDRAVNLARVVWISAQIRDNPQASESLREMANALAQHRVAVDWPWGTLLAGVLSFLVLASLLWLTRLKPDGSDHS
jgi:hypothetical protein